MTTKQVTESEIQALLEEGESIILECKASGNALSRDLWETYSAFANTYGGWILLGIQELNHSDGQQPFFEITGMKNISQRLKEFWDLLNSDKVSANILLDEDVTPVKVNEKDILAIHVPAALYTQKPVYINGNPYKGTYRRNYEGDYHCSQNEIRSMIRDSFEEGTDGNLLPFYTMDDIDQASLQEYRTLFNISHRGHVWGKVDDREFLMNLGGYVRDRKTGEEGLSTAGLLMFGKGLSIRERFSNLAFDYLDCSDLQDGQRWSDRLSIDGSWENNLFQFVTKVLPKLTQGLPKPFQVNGLRLKEETDLHLSVREALINMVIHADYQIMGRLLVKRYDDGFLFSNPGNLRLSVSRIFEGEHTAARNPRIQTMFRMIGYCENIGSGFPTILQTWKSRQWREPDLSDSFDLRTVDLRLWMTRTLPQQAEQQLNRLFGTRYLSCTEEEQTILAKAALEEGVSAAELEPLLKKDPLKISGILADLVKRKFLRREMKGYKPVYKVCQEKAQTQNLLVTDTPDPQTKTDERLLDLLKTRQRLTNRLIVDSVESINTVAGALKAMDRLIDKGLAQKHKEGRTVIYTPADQWPK